MKDNLETVRESITEIDHQLVQLFEKRMACSATVAQLKKEHSLPIINTAREREIVADATENMDDYMGEYTKMLYATIFDLSRSYQEQLASPVSQLVANITQSIETTPKLFPKNATVACQGAEGANSTRACDKLFSRAHIMYMTSFDAVFKAVDQGLCEYGILPIENSLHGSVSEVYDLMKRYDFHISRSAKVKIDHVFLGKSGVKIGDITEVYSHPQAIAQCNQYLDTLSGVTIVECENTAIAAEMVSKSDRRDIAAIADSACRDLYGLEIVNESISNNTTNYTRFICISKHTEIYPGASKVSVMFAIPHAPGSLYTILSKFSALGLNMSKLESRPIPGKDFEFMFYVDIEGDVCDERIQKLLAILEKSADKFTFLGAYSEP